MARPDPVDPEEPPDDDAEALTWAGDLDRGVAPTRPEVATGVPPAEG